MKITKKIGLIGCGNMGSAILAGAFRKGVCSAKNVWVADKYADKVKSFAKTNRCHSAADAADAVAHSDIILLAVKPQDLVETAEAIRPFLNKNKIVISILAGVRLEKLQKLLKPAAVVRSMPNLGAQVGASVTAICSSKSAALKPAQALFEACGRVVTLPEKNFDVVTAVSGSGPAYFFLMMELLQAFAQKNGLSETAARDLAVQTALGAGMLAAASQETPATLRERVTSKKGTTHAALSVLKYRGFPNVFFAALNAAAKRSRELSR